MALISIRPTADGRHEVLSDGEIIARFRTAAEANGFARRQSEDGSHPAGGSRPLPRLKRWSCR